MGKVKMTWRTPLFLVALVGGPFISVAAVTFYRRALAWWYEHKVDMSTDAADAWSVIVMILIVMVGGFSTIWRVSEGNWWWEKHQ